MKTLAAIPALLAVVLGGSVQAMPGEPALAHRIAVTTEIKKAFSGHDAIEVKEITGTAANFQVGGTYRITGVCRQETLARAVLYVGNTAEPGGPRLCLPTGHR